MTHTPPTLSAIVITRNEAHNLHDCLQSMRGLVDEIIVVDSQSTDATVAIAQQHGAKVSQPADWPGFGPQKNRALALATCDWVFSIDADERVTPELAEEIKRVLLHTADANVAYQVPRLSWYCGRFMKHSGWQPDHVLRLFKRGTAKFTDDLVHERLVVNAQTQKLTGILLHYSFLNFSQVLLKINAYSDASAKQAYLKGKRATVFTAVGHGFWAFFKTYFLKAGFLDGQHGLALAISNAEGSYYRYLKIWRLEQDAKHVD
jgi:glycosyltransferase involved in cell wall biosynthesis